MPASAVAQNADKNSRGLSVRVFCRRQKLYGRTEKSPAMLSVCSFSNNALNRAIPSVPEAIRKRRFAPPSFGRLNESAYKYLDCVVAKSSYRGLQSVRNRVSSVAEKRVFFPSFTGLRRPCFTSSYNFVRPMQRCCIASLTLYVAFMKS